MTGGGQDLQPDLSRFEFWWQGELRPDQVFLQPQHSSGFALTEFERHQVTQICEQHRLRGQRVENLPLYRFEWFSQGETGLHLRVSTTGYEDYLGLGLLGHAQAPLVLAVAATTEIEGRLVLERRSAQVAQGIGLLHVKPSGHIHPPASPWQALLQESLEELALEEHELENVLLLGLVRSGTANCVTFLFHLQTRLRWTEWSARTPVDAWESQELLGLATDPESLREWLAAPRELSTGPCYAAIWRYYQWRYGATGELDS